MKPRACHLVPPALVHLEALHLEDDVRERAGGVLVHVCGPLPAALVARADQLEDLVEVPDYVLPQARHVVPPLLVKLQVELLHRIPRVHRGLLQQIRHCLVVDLQVRDRDQVALAGVGGHAVEDFFDHKGDETPIVAGVDVALHCVGFAAAGLAVGHDRRVAAFHHGVHDGDGLAVDVAAATCAVVDAVEVLPVEGVLSDLVCHGGAADADDPALCVVLEHLVLGELFNHSAWLEDEARLHARGRERRGLHAGVVREGEGGGHGPARGFCPGRL
mmetsp:Transcript_19937/g.63422  ORF Transcript_19937/g.63422 Transcript_19937/m.63422 type:complete len:274 (-) Transcript_19937:132-953(-)